MPSQFATDFSACSPDLDDRFGEPVTLIAMVETDSTAYIEQGEDPTRTERALVGCFSDDPVVSTTLGSGANTHENTDVLARRTYVDFADTLFADPVAQPYPGAGWIVRCEDQPGSPLYQVVSSQHDGVSRVVCKVVYQGLSPA